MYAPPPPTYSSMINDLWHLPFSKRTENEQIRLVVRKNKLQPRRKWDLVIGTSGHEDDFHILQR